MVSGILADRLGIRTVGLIGGLLALAGMLSSAFVQNLSLLYLTYGVIMGTGFSLAYTPSLAILGHYFKRRIGLANGLVTFGGVAVFTVSYTLALPVLFDAIGFKYTLMCISGSNSNLLPICLGVPNAVMKLVMGSLSDLQLVSRTGVKTNAFKCELRNRFSALDTLPEETIEEHWHDLRETWTATCREVLGKKTRQHKEWLTSDTWDLITERKRLKDLINHTDDQDHKRDLQAQYWDVNRQAKRSARNDKRNFINDLTEEAETAAGQRNMKRL
nr:hypothetical protein BaRGS_020541 [Batillaria attramentaria]